MRFGFLIVNDINTNFLENLSDDSNIIRSGETHRHEITVILFSLQNKKGKQVIAACNTAPIHAKSSAFVLRPAVCLTAHCTLSYHLTYGLFRKSALYNV
jgi:hypothetical protein